MTGSNQRRVGWEPLPADAGEAKPQGDDRPIPNQRPLNCHRRLPTNPTTARIKTGYLRRNKHGEERRPTAHKRVITSMLWRNYVSG
ncbi:hypothetical protein K469DRAFT_702489 [Zopfia rhizophila CBS 207.26]|uniref:Uncharacterized protein n=1 Tax=Zopfia rhizophila CBS 207.26 TaxID=1314779 RepID=A0A6A6EA02_9PEZI|nr:hypothetical protein K469DRAFT_702489 [Zopfia rhizophila CBS 207.26]